MILAASDLKPLADVAPSPSDAADKPAAKPGEKPGADERDVVVLTVQKPVKAGSRVS
jgi:hypothetical protein